MSRYFLLTQHLLHHNVPYSRDSLFSCVTITHSHHSWNGAGLQSYFDAAISIILPFTDWFFKLQSSLSAGQIITLSLLNGYLTLRFYQKTLATVAVAQQTVTLKESVERECLRRRSVVSILSILILLKLTLLPLCRNRTFTCRSTLYLVSTHGQNCSQNSTRDQ